jgi:hypothetical protein
MGPAWDRCVRLLTPALATLCVFQLASWLPWYLVRPWFADHDVFATMAQGWEAGQLPYRDLIGNNFPGTIYLFWVLGKLFGWGCVPALFAVDAALLVVLGGMLVVWSRTCLGRALPGLVGYVMVLSYYLELDYSQAAQRDWHAALLAVVGILAAQTWPNLAGWLIAAVGLAAGGLIRPQVILLAPAVLTAVAGGAKASGASTGKTAGVAAGWLVLVAGLTALGFLPLVLAGVVDDLIRGVRMVAFGGDYNSKTVVTVAYQLFDEVTTFKVLSVSVALLVLVRLSPRGSVRFVAATWLVALAGALLNAPLSPVARPYSFHPLWLVWAVNVAVLVELILETDLEPRWHFLAVLFLLGMGASVRPRYCRPGPIRETLAALRERREVATRPPSYRHPYPTGWALPVYEDYHHLLQYLRHDLEPGLRIACLLKGVAVTSPTGRLSALPAESATWVYVVNPRDEPLFVRRLEEARETVVVWDPTHPVDEFGRSTPELNEAVRRLYRPSARFGSLEVWRRRTEPESP